MSESVEPDFSGALTLRHPICLGDKWAAHLYCTRWSFRTDESLGFSPLERRSPSKRALFAVALGPIVNDPEDPGEGGCDVLAVIPAANVLGFIACNKAPLTAASLDPELAPA
jgi:hypothetical protein